MTKRRRFLRWLAARLPRRDICGPHGEPYLIRYRIARVLGIGVYLHRFVADDPGRGVHDHPWPWSFGLVLDGEYLEWRACDDVIPTLPGSTIYLCSRRYGPGALNWLRGDTFHRLLLVNEIKVDAEPAEVWSLFVHGPRRKGWGFLVYDGFDDPMAHYSCGLGVTAQRVVEYRPVTLTRYAAPPAWDEPELEQ